MVAIGDLNGRHGERLPAAGLAVHQKEGHASLALRHALHQGLSGLLIDVRVVAGL